MIGIRVDLSENTSIDSNTIYNAYNTLNEQHIYLTSTSNFTINNNILRSSSETPRTFAHPCIQLSTTTSGRIANNIIYKGGTSEIYISSSSDKNTGS